MANKDLTQKALLRVPDVFASLVNLILFKTNRSFNLITFVILT